MRVYIDLLCWLICIAYGLPMVCVLLAYLSACWLLWLLIDCRSIAYWLFIDSLSKTPAVWHRRTTQFGTSCVCFAAVSSFEGRHSIQKAKIIAQERLRMRMRMCANKNKATNDQIVNQSMVFMISAIKLFRKDVWGGLGDTGQPGPKSIWKIGSKIIAGNAIVGRPFQACLLKSTL